MVDLDKMREVAAYYSTDGRSNVGRMIAAAADEIERLRAPVTDDDLAEVERRIGGNSDLTDKVRTLVREVQSLRQKATSAPIAGPSPAERLVAYRCAVTVAHPEWNPTDVECHAHVMLAAEVTS